MQAELSFAISAHNEERYIGRCIESILDSARRAGKSVEIAVTLNRCTDSTRHVAESLGALCVVEDRKCIAAVRNAAVRAGTAAATATLDAYSWLTKETVARLLARICDERYIGGVALVLPERWSPGIALSLCVVAAFVIPRCVSAGMFWFRRKTFEALGGFNEELASAEDLDFAMRMKALGRGQGKRYGTIWHHGIRTSCRKFDDFGDWFLFRNPRLVRRILSGRDQAAANRFYYDVRP